MAENIEAILQDLIEGKKVHRIKAAQDLALLEQSSARIVRALESAVISDPSEEVQDAALAALSMPVHQQIQRRLTFTLERDLFLDHIDRWAADGLLTPQVTALLKGRYAPEPEPLDNPQPSETAISEEVADVSDYLAMAPSVEELETATAEEMADVSSPSYMDTHEEELEEVISEELAEVSDYSAMAPNADELEEVMSEEVADLSIYSTIATSVDELEEAMSEELADVSSPSYMDTHEEELEEAMSEELVVVSNYSDTPPSAEALEEEMIPLTDLFQTSPKSARSAAPSRKLPVLYDGELSPEDADMTVAPPVEEDQPFSLIDILLSERTIKIALYLGAFMIVVAAVIFAQRVELARFPMLSLTLVGFLVGAGSTIERLPLGSFVLFVIGTLLIPIDAVVFFELINTDASLFYWSVVIGGMSLVWGGGTYFYQSRFFSVMVFATFSMAVYLMALSMSVNPAVFLLVVGLVALAGMGETTLLQRWQGDNFFEPMFFIAQIQAIGVFGVLAVNLLSLVSHMLDRIVLQGGHFTVLGTNLVSELSDSFAVTVRNSGLSPFDSQEIPLLVTWIVLGVFYYASDDLTRQMKKWGLPAFRILVTACVALLPIFIIETISATPHQMAAILWVWGGLMAFAADWLHLLPIRWIRSYAFLFLVASIPLLLMAPLVEYVTTPEYAAGYFMATSLVCFAVAYRRVDSTLWSIALVTAYIAYLVGAQSMSSGSSPVAKGFALLVPPIVFLSVELAARRYFRANSSWTGTPLVLGLFNAVWNLSIVLSWYSGHPGHAALILFIYGVFGVMYALLDNQPKRGQAVVAWIGGLIALYAAYIHVVPNINQLQLNEGGYILLAPALIYLSAERIGKRYFRAGPSWTQPLLGFGCLNLILDVLVTLAGGFDNYPGTAATIFLVYGVFCVLYALIDARLDEKSEFALTAWTVGLVSLNVAYGFFHFLPAIEGRHIFLGFTLLIPALVYLSAELIGKLHFRASLSWTLPLFGLGLFNAALSVWATVDGGLNDAADNAVIIFLIYGIFCSLYAWFDSEYERDYAILAWIIGLFALYVSYWFVYALPEIDKRDIFLGYAFLIPALAYLSAELVGKLYFQMSREWTYPLLGLGLLNAAIGIAITLDGGLSDHPQSAVIIMFIYGVFSLVYATLVTRSERDYAINAWIIGLIALYAAYGFVYSLPEIKEQGIFIGYAFLIPALVFLSAELVGKLYFQFSRAWTYPLLALGLLNVGLGVPFALDGGLTYYPESAVTIFLIYGLFGLMYAALEAKIDRNYAITAWPIGLLALYVAYWFVYSLPGIKERDIFIGYALLIPVIVFLLAELAGKLYFQFSRAWTLPLLSFGLFNVVVGIPFTLEGGLKDAPGSAAIIFIVYGLFGMVYAALEARVKAENVYAIIAWTFGLITLYTAYLFVAFDNRLPIIDDSLATFLGYTFLIPTLVFLSGELAAKLHFQMSRSWTYPLLGLGLLNAGMVVLVTFTDVPGYVSGQTYGSSAFIFLIYGLFGVLYAWLNTQLEREYGIIAWIVGLVALYVAYLFAYRLPVIEDLDIFSGYAFLMPALVFLSAELAAKLYFRYSQSWTYPLLGLGLMNAVMLVLVTLSSGLDYAPGSAVIIFLIYGLFSILYAWLDTQLEREYGIIAWIVGLIALYVSYVFVYNLPVIEDLDIFSGYAFLMPALVFLSAELAAKLYFRYSQSWTYPLLGLGLMNAVLVVQVTLPDGLDNVGGRMISSGSVMSSSTMIIFLIYGLFSILYAWLDTKIEREYGIIAWVVGLIALYISYLYVYVFLIEDLTIFPGYALLVLVLVFLSAELVAKLHFHYSQSWTYPLLGLGLLNVLLLVPVTVLIGMDDAASEAVIIFLICGLFSILYTWLDAEYEREYATVAWIAGLIALYASYGFIYKLPAIEDRHIFSGYALLIPALAFLSAELAAKFYFQLGKVWTQPLFIMGLLNAVLVVPVAIDGGLNGHPGSAAIVFLIYGLFGVVYPLLDKQFELGYTITIWIAGLIALYVSYGFVCLMPAIQDRHIFIGYAPLIPAIAFLSAELVSKHYFRASEPWTQPLFGLGLLNAVLVVPATLGQVISPAAVDGSQLDMSIAPGSIAIILLVYGLFIALYAVSDNKPPELGYLATGSIVLALTFALIFYEQEYWVAPFIVLTLVYYLGGLAVDYLYQEHEWSYILYWSGLVLGTAIALSAPFQGGGAAVVGMGIIATIYGAEALRRENVWLGLPANGLFFSAYLLALQELNVVEPQFYSIGTALLAIVTHYLLSRKSEGRAAFMIGFTTGWIAQVILLGTSFIQMDGGLQFFFLLFFQSLILLAYGIVTSSLSFTIVPIVFVVSGVIRLVFMVSDSFSPVVTLACTGSALVLLGITALLTRERLAATYEELQLAENQTSNSKDAVFEQIRSTIKSLVGLS